MENSMSTYDQKVWLKSEEAKDPKKRHKWLSEANPEVIHFMNIDTGEESVRPAAYGVLLGSDEYKVEADALHKANEVIQSFSEQEKDASFDTHKRGIDGWSMKTARDLQGLHINLCFYLGLELDDSDDDKKEVIQNFVDFLMNDKIVKPSYYSLLIDKLNNSLPKDDDADLDFDMLLDILCTVGFTGILMSVSTPVRKYTENKSGYRYSIGNQYYTWVYGDNFDLALSRAKDWMLTMEEHDKQKSHAK